MAQYTMEIRQLVNNPLTKLFNFDYPFYVNHYEAKKQFEELFINHYYFHEIGTETFERWEQMLKARLMMIMPYYEQLYQTQWNVVKKDMMLSKDLEETTTRVLKSSSDETKDITSNQSNENTSEATMNSTDESEGTTSGSGTGSSKESSLTDGVAVVGVDGDLTSESTNQTSTTSSSSSSGSNQTTSSASNESNFTSTGSESSTGSNELEETITFKSMGDVGIQTPAYAITEWRKVIININEMIINECKDLFMQIY